MSPRFRSTSARALTAAAALVPLPAWAAGPIPTWAAYGLFIVAAIVVIALLLREALFDGTDDEQPKRNDVNLRHPQARYDAREAAHKTAANRRVA